MLHLQVANADDWQPPIQAFNLSSTFNFKITAVENSSDKSYLVRFTSISSLSNA